MEVIYRRLFDLDHFFSRRGHDHEWRLDQLQELMENIFSDALSSRPPLFIEFDNLRSEVVENFISELERVALLREVQKKIGSDYNNSSFGFRLGASTVASALISLAAMVYTYAYGDPTVDLELDKFFIKFWGLCGLACYFGTQLIKPLTYSRDKDYIFELFPKACSKALTKTGKP